jgi:predicted transcriptional regulator
MNEPKPMSLKLPDDLRAELHAVAEELGESDATVARMSMRHGLRVLLQTLKSSPPEATAVTLGMGA